MTNFGVNLADSIGNTMSTVASDFSATFSDNAYVADISSAIGDILIAILVIAGLVIVARWLWKSFKVGGRG